MKITRSQVLLEQRGFREESNWEFAFHRGLPSI
jgi:hypothetical protein